MYLFVGSIYLPNNLPNKLPKKEIIFIFVQNKITPCPTNHLTPSLRRLPIWLHKLARLSEDTMHR